MKGWLDADGNMQDKIFDVVWSGDCDPEEDGKLLLIGSTVDIARQMAGWGSFFRTSLAEVGPTVAMKSVLPGRLVATPGTGYSTMRQACSLKSLLVVNAGAESVPVTGPQR